MPEIAYTEPNGNIFYHPAAGQERLQIAGQTRELVRTRSLFDAEAFNQYVVNMAALLGYKHEISGYIISSHESHDRQAKRENFGLVDPNRSAYFRFKSLNSLGEVEIYLPRGQEELTYQPDE